MSDFLNNLPDLGLQRNASRRKKKQIDLEDVVVKYVRIKCPKCGCHKVPVYDTNHLPIRYHKCSKCGLNFKSIEE